MRYIRIAAVSLIIAVMGLSASYADYRFDDIQGPSGKGSQWVVMNDANETFGAPTSTAIQLSSDVMSIGTDAVLNVLSGNSDTTVNDRNIQTLFLVLYEGQGTFDMNAKSQTLGYDVSTPEVDVNTIVNENQVPYFATKEADQSNNTSSEWKNFRFSLYRQNYQHTYDTVVQSFTFQQNPGNAPSQTITRPFVISNVHSGTAASMSAPLVLRMALRDSPSTAGNIIAYDRAVWQMTDNMTTGGNQWVFIPVDDLNTDNKRIEYNLTTEIANNTAYRYAMRYADSTGGTLPPDEWRFDLFRQQGTTNLPRSFLLAAESQIAPGLVTVYHRRYNINEQNKSPLHVFPVDTPDNGDFDLTLNHKIIFGKDLGSYKYPASEGRFNLFETTAFQPRPASTTFYDDIATVTKSYGKVSVPTNTIFSSSSVKREIIADDVLEYFTISQNIPSNVQNSTSEGMLPLYITINIPVTRISDNAWWNNMLKVWRDSGRIEDIFAQKYDIYLRAGESNIWNLTQELADKGVYNDLVKVFLDEDRGRLTQDNYSGVLTLSFIVMLMDGTRDGVRPELSIVRDNSVVQENRYIVVRDGYADNKWEMTFFVAPAGWQNNPNRNSNNPVNTISGDRGASAGGSGGGGCAVFSVSALIALSVLFVKRERRDEE